MTKRKPKPKPKPKPKKRVFSNRPLDKLSKLRKNHNKLPKEQNNPLENTQPVSEPLDDRKLFSDAMTSVKPIHSNQHYHLPKRAIEHPDQSSAFNEQQENQEVMQSLRDLIEGDAPLCIYETDETIEGAIEGLDHRIMKKLRRGEFSIQEYLDLHGFTKDEARDLVEQFLLNAIHQGKRCVLIVHGRGHRSKDNIPVLKNALKTWLTRRALRKKVLAFTTAKPYDGGTGAIYVLLRKHLRNPSK